MPFVIVVGKGRLIQKYIHLPDSTPSLVNVAEMSHSFTSISQVEQHKAAGAAAAPRLVVLGLDAAGSSSGALSFPFLDGLNRPLNHPDIFQLATLAEKVA